VVTLLAVSFTFLVATLPRSAVLIIAAFIQHLVCVTREPFCRPTGYYDHFTPLTKLADPLTHMTPDPDPSLLYDQASYGSAQLATDL